MIGYFATHVQARDPPPPPPRARFFKRLRINTYPLACSYSARSIHINFHSNNRPFF